MVVKFEHKGQPVMTTATGHNVHNGTCSGKWRTAEVESSQHEKLAHMTVGVGL
jgi:hypothetical protein